MSIFRREALEHQRDQWLGHVSLVQPVSLRVLTALVAACALAVGVFLAGSHYTRKAQLAGVLVPQGGIAELRASEDSLVVERRVHEGDVVRRGDVLFVLAFDRRSAAGDTQAQVQRSLDERRRSLETAADRQRRLATAQRDELSRRIDALAAERVQHEQRAALQRERLVLAEQALAQFEQLKNQDFISPAQLRAKRQDVLEQRERLQGLAQERAEYERRLTALEAQHREQPLQADGVQGQIERELASLRAQAAESEAGRSRVLRAPHDGIVAAVVAEPGQAVHGGAVLARLTPPDAPLLAQLYAPSSAIGFVRPEQPVLLRYHAFPYQKFGAQPGRVLEVSRTPVPDAAAAEAGLAARPAGPLYRITVALDRQRIDGYGAPQPLLPGMQLDADVQLDRRRLIEWLFEPLLGLAGRL